MADVEAARRVEAARPEHRGELEGLLESVFGQPDAGRVLVAAERALGADELRRELGIPLADFNRALRDFGRPPIHFVEGHDAAFGSFLAANRDWVLDAIRSHFPSSSSVPAGISVSTRSSVFSKGLEPDPEWLDTFVVPDDELMHRQVTQWLNAHGISPAPADSDLTALDTVRQGNEELLDGQLPLFRNVVTAWCERFSHERPDAWADTGESFARSCKILDASTSWPSTLRTCFVGSKPWVSGPPTCP